MKVGMPVSCGRVSTAFDFAQRLLVVDYQSGKEISRTEISLDEESPLNRARSLKRRGVQALICGAISRSLAKDLEAAGIDLAPFVSGPVEEVLAAYISGELESVRFLMPGSTAEQRKEWRKTRPEGALADESIK